MVNDPIADLLTRIRNAVLRSQEEVRLPGNKMLVSIVKILKDSEMINDYEVVDPEKGKIQKEIVISLKYLDDGKPAMTHLKRISKPGLRKYISYKDVKPILNNLGIGILSTPKGVISTKQAITEKVGGEYLCEIW